MTVSPTEATVDPGDSVRFTVRFETAGLGEGLYQSGLAITSDDASSPHVVHVTLAVGDVVGVGGGDPAPAPQAGSLGNHPNPFNPRTIVRFANPAEGRVRLAVYDLRGRRVRLLVDERRAAGRHEILWDGTDDRGAAVASGVYLVGLVDAQGGRARHKVSLLR